MHVDVEIERYCLQDRLQVVHKWFVVVFIMRYKNRHTAHLLLLLLDPNKLLSMLSKSTVLHNEGMIFLL